MKKRLISCSASDVRKMTSKELKNAIIASEGRVILAETVVTTEPLLPGITNAEIMSGFGADLILLNMYDVFTRYISGMEDVEAPIEEIKGLTGRLVGINLEPVDTKARALEDLTAISRGRIATKESIVETGRQGVDFIVLTGNPATGVTNPEIEKAIRVAKENFGGLVFAGKMHGAGVEEKLLDQEQILKFVDAGADGVLLPAPGTAPGIREEASARIVEQIKTRGAIAISAVGTSQEGADPETIRQLGLCCKRIGYDVQHLGDGGVRMAEPENLMALSMCIRGRRHTYYRMSQSIHR